MVARTVIAKRRAAAIERIEEQATLRAQGSTALGEAAERIRSANGPDEAHTELFRLEAIADLMELANEAPAEVQAEAKPRPKRQTAKKTTETKK